MEKVIAASTRGGSTSPWWVTALRVALGALVLATGLGKALDLPGFVGVVRTYELGLPDPFLWLAAVAVTVGELLLGAWLLSGRSTRAAALWASLLNLGYAALLGTALWRGLELENCGCFGVFFPRPLQWTSPIEDLGLVAACLVLWHQAPLKHGR